jgi:putative MATE family efflux protein
MNKRLLETENIGKLLRNFSIPAIASMLMGVMYNVVDRMFISIGIGREGIAGVSLSLPIFNTFLATALFIGVGAGAMVSIYLGAKKQNDAEKVLGNALVLMLIFGITYLVLGKIFIKKILLMFGASPATYSYALDYLSTIFWGAPFLIMFSGLNNIVRGEGSPKRSMTYGMIGMGLNTIFDPIFIFVFGWGIKGAAWATVLSAAIAVMFYLRHFSLSVSNIKWNKNHFKLELKTVKDIFSIGIAPFVMQLSTSAIMIVMNKVLKINGGDIAVAAYGIINSLVLLMRLPVVGLYQGAQPIISYNFGANRTDRVYSTLKLALKVAIIMGTVGFIVAFFLPWVLVKPFIKNDPELYALTVNGVKIMFVAVIALAYNTIATTYFQSVKKANITTMLNLGQQIFLIIPLLLIMPKYFGINGAWAVQPIADVILMVVAYVFIKKEQKVLLANIE